MFNREDNTYNEIREKSLFQWLDEMEKHAANLSARQSERLCVGCVV